MGNLGIAADRAKMLLDNYDPPSLGCSIATGISHTFHPFWSSFLFLPHRHDLIFDPLDPKSANMTILDFTLGVNHFIFDFSEFFMTLTPMNTKHSCLNFDFHVGCPRGWQWWWYWCHWFPLILPKWSIQADPIVWLIQLPIANGSNTSKGWWLPSCAIEDMGGIASIILWWQMDWCYLDLMKMLLSDESHWLCQNSWCFLSLIPN